MTNHEGAVTEAEARELWRRATELQRAAEEPESGEEVLPPVGPDAVPMHRVLEAAEEADIPVENVLLAVAERSLVDAAEIRPDRWSARWLRYLVNEADAIEVTRVLRAPVGEVVAATERVTSTDPYRVVLENRWEGQAEGPVVLVYRSQGVSFGMSSSFRSGLELCDARVLLVSIRRNRDTTRLRVRVPRYRRNLNLALAGGSTGLFGAGGTAGGTAVGQAAAGLVGIAAFPAAVGLGALGAIVGAGAGIWGFRRLHAWGGAKGRAAVEQLVRAIAMEVEGSQGNAGTRMLPDESGGPSEKTR